MSVHFADAPCHAAVGRASTADEILRLRQAGWADGRLSREEAEAIFAAQHAIANPGEDWSDFFVEALSNYVLHGTEPRGYAGEDEARWLIEQVEKDGRICSMTEFELLVQVIEKGQNVPETLKSYVLDVLEREVLTGTGPTRCGGELSDTHVIEAEARIIRQVIFDSASDRPAAVSRREAEMLFRIKDGTLADANASEFERLFVQGVGNYLMGFASTSAHLDRERVLELQAFVADNEPQIGRFMGRMAKAAPNAFGKTPVEPGLAEGSAEAAEVTACESDWLEAQISANGQTDRYDQKLLAFIAEETGEA